MTAAAGERPADQTGPGQAAEVNPHEQCNGIHVRGDGEHYDCDGNAL